MLEMPVKCVRQILGESDSRMWRMLFAHVEAACARLSSDNVVWVGANEINRGKGQNSLTVVSNLFAKGMPFAIRGKHTTAWIKFSPEILDREGGPKATRQVTIEMSVASTSQVRDNLRNAQVVYEKFNVIQNVAEGWNQVRKVERRSDAGKRELLERTRWMWLKNPANWTEKEANKSESMALERWVTGLVYEMRLVLQPIYQLKDVEVAKRMFGNWCAWVKAMREQTGQLLEPMGRAARMIEGQMEGILAHWAHGLTTAFMERLNCLF
jgi:transposase